MSVRRIAGSILDAEERFEGFENLMPFKVQNILLVSSLYDSFILREDGRLNELLIDESLELNLRQIPGIAHVSSCAEAVELARSQPQFNLIVTNLAVGDMDAAQLAREVKRAGLDVPVLVLAYDYREIKNFVARNPVTEIERIFLWQGNARILIAMVKYIEDKRNVLHDTQAIGVPVLLVVEDNIRYYSSFLPVIYTELIKQSKRVIQEGINVAHKLVRMQARPRILLSSNFEEAAGLVEEYRDYLFGLVSDVEFPWEGKLNPEAGFELARMVKSLVPDVPVVLQTSRTEFRPRAHSAGYSFLRKRSPTLLKDLRRILTEQFGFGDFVFRLPDASEVGRAKDLNELEERLQTVPAESLVFHSQSNHFSHWLMARTEFALAAKLRPRKVSDFAEFGTSAARSDRVDPRVSPGTERGADRRLPGRYVQAFGIEFSADRLRIAGRQGSRPRFRAPPFAQEPYHPPLSRRSHRGASRRRPGDGCVRSISGREQSSRLCLAFGRRRGNSAEVPSHTAIQIPQRRPEIVSGRGKPSVGGALVQPAGGFAIPAFYRRV